MVIPGRLRRDHDAAGSRHIVYLYGELDLASAPELVEVVGQLVVEGAHSITLNMAALTFMDACGLRAVTEMRKHCDDHGCELRLTPCQRQVQRLFDITGLQDDLRESNGRLAPAPERLAGKRRRLAERIRTEHLHQA